jgi:hypothetical protein
MHKIKDVIDCYVQSIKIITCLNTRLDLCSLKVERHVTMIPNNEPIERKW